MLEEQHARLPVLSNLGYALLINGLIQKGLSHYLPRFRLQVAVPESSPSIQRQPSGKFICARPAQPGAVGIVSRAMPQFISPPQILPHTLNACPIMHFCPSPHPLLV